MDYMFHRDTCIVDSGDFDRRNDSLVNVSSDVLQCTGRRHAWSYVLKRTGFPMSATWYENDKLASGLAVVDAGMQVRDEWIDFSREWKVLSQLIWDVFFIYPVTLLGRVVRRRPVEARGVAVQQFRKYQLVTTDPIQLSFNFFRSIINDARYRMFMTPRIMRSHLINMYGGD